MTVQYDYALTIYGQTGGSGKLVASGWEAAGIGGNNYRPGGMVTINGGTVTAGRGGACPHRFWVV